MMSHIFKLWLTMCSLVLTLTVYLIKENILLNSLAPFLPWEDLRTYVCLLPKYASFVAYAFVVVSCTWIGLFITRFLGQESINSNDVEAIEPANDTFLPSYLGYFFVALSINDFDTFIYVFSLIFIFVFFSKISYFNPVFLLFRLKFFYVTNSCGTKIVLITRKDLKSPSDVVFEKLKRINNYTFISREK
ncbi:hypothetical protein [Vibrio crassostreae]|uniref:hypothetical protein n=1 Tax=Vibrio crassostreae TaxID=246167 RepID=UPI001FEF01F5|nr:hypothetical protein [Vibrio crassostreae]